MSDQLVTVATFRAPTEANFARIRLDDAGIKAVLADEEAVGIMPHMSNAIGGVKVQVAPQDLERAEAILWEETPVNPAELDEAWKVAPEQMEPGSEPPSDEPPNEVELLSDRERMADRAYRGMVLGLLFLPLQIHASWLLIKVLYSEEPLRGSHRRNAQLAALVSFPLTLLIVTILCFCLIRL